MLLLNAGPSPASATSYRPALTLCRRDGAPSGPAWKAPRGDSMCACVMEP